MNVNGCSGSTACGALAQLGRVALAAVAAHLLQRDRLVGPGAPSAIGSITTIVSSAGSWSRTARIFATCDASSQTIARASELPATHAHSSGEFVG